MTTPSPSPSCCGPAVGRPFPSSRRSWLGVLFAAALAALVIALAVFSEPPGMSISDIFATMGLGAWILLLSALPVFLLLRLACAIVWKIRKIHPSQTLCWPDVLTFLLVPFVWSALEHVGAPKSLANLSEWFYLSWLWCLCMTIRYVLASKGKLRHPLRAAWITLAVVLSATALSAIFFPCLPE